MRPLAESHINGEGSAGMPEHRLGFIINPLAGMGGSVGLKGTDGSLAERARALGAEPQAGKRAQLTLEYLATRALELRILSAGGFMGADVAEAAGYDPIVVYELGGSDVTTFRDTHLAASALVEAGIELLLFAGGDGTARDILSCVGSRVPVLGIPCGVKMHSAVFAASTRAASDVTAAFLQSNNPSAMLRDAEIMDREATSGGEAASPALFGFVRTPQLADLVAPAKAGSGEAPMLAGACCEVSRVIRQDDRVSLLGPGSTVQRIKTELGIPGTLLGVDAVRGSKLLGADLGERGILDLISGQPARIVIGVVGGQGFLFGRGNQQLSPRVIRRVGLDNILIVASVEKLAALPGKRLLVDTGDEMLDEMLCGWRSVVTAARRTTIIRVRPVSHESAGALE